MPRTRLVKTEAPQRPELDKMLHSALRKSAKVAAIPITREEAEIIFGWWDFTQDIGDAPDDAEVKLAQRIQAFVEGK